MIRVNAGTIKPPEVKTAKDMVQHIHATKNSIGFIPTTKEVLINENDKIVSIPVSK